MHAGGIGLNLHKSPFLFFFCQLCFLFIYRVHARSSTLKPIDVRKSIEKSLNLKKLIDHPCMSLKCSMEHFNIIILYVWVISSKNKLFFKGENQKDTVPFIYTCILVCICSICMYGERDLKYLIIMYVCIVQWSVEYQLNL